MSKRSKPELQVAVFSAAVGINCSLARPDIGPLVSACEAGELAEMLLRLKRATPRFAYLLNKYGVGVGELNGCKSALWKHGASAPIPTASRGVSR